MFRNELDKQKPQNHKIVFNTKDGFYVLDSSEIIYIKSCSDYLEIYSTRAEIINSSKRLKSLKNILSNPAFFRSHRSYIINYKRFIP